MTPNKKQIANLRKLSAYLAALPKDYEHFDIMSFYWVESEHGGLYPTEIKKVPLGQCGTSACAVGHGPFAGIPVRGDVDWWDYCKRVFGIEGGTVDFRRLFGIGNPNCPHKAATRINKYLASLDQPA